MNFSNIDLVVFFGYIAAIMAIGLWLSFNHKDENAKDYFLAGKSLPWWAVGGSLIASNISAEQFIGMSGSDYVVDMAIASYELMAAITLVIVAKFFLPIFLEKNIYTWPFQNIYSIQYRYYGNCRHIEYHLCGVVVGSLRLDS
ncbi:MAG: hypothetical protein GY751_16070 [Bacteroidetes bacterium]|nr:hypothetical protein [Bacteroidota bacterium]